MQIALTVTLHNVQVFMRETSVKITKKCELMITRCLLLAQVKQWDILFYVLMFVTVVFLHTKWKIIYSTAKNVK